ncbi:MAG TPA: hypothetical protein VJU83_00425 [Burkholderiales bacterium]|nr:hypothetical protein [Burkholderiales bacterium]
MLREILGVSQDEPHIERRWFHDEYFDLFVRQESNGRLCSFELCYGSPGSEKALVWEDDAGYFHDGVEDKDIDGGGVLGFPPESYGGTDPIVSRFDLVAKSLPDTLRTAVSERVHEYASHAELTASRRRQFRRAEWQQKSETR